MKKLMFALAAASLVGLAHAAQAKWKYSASNIYNGGGDSAAKYSGNAYIFDAATTSQESLFGAFLKDYLNFDVENQSGYLGGGTVANGAINANTQANQFGAFEQGSGAYNFFFVLIDGNKMYLSVTKNAKAGSTDASALIAFGNQSGSKLSDLGYQGTGTWSVVPEPTSGLMILLGLAGLALRRKQA